MPPERESDLVETLVDRQVVHSSKYLTFVSDTIADAKGHSHTRQVVLHPGAVTVAAVLPDGRVLLVRQYRHAAGRVMLELPAGTLDKLADGSMEDPLDAAKRELWEETGHHAAKWRALASFWTAPGFASERMTLFLATGLTPGEGHTPEEDENLLVEALALPELLARVRRDEIDDAKTLIGLYWLEALARDDEIEELRWRITAT
jgi:ADP-ribose pyrophosphatase